MTCLALLAAAGTACSNGDGRSANPSRVPSPSFTPTGKPGGTLRVVGTTRSVPLDPALARTDAALLVNRLVLRQLYSYLPGEPDPVPDLASAAPKLSSDRMTASISLRPNARWSVPGGRTVTAGDVLRGMKRLCGPTVLAPERGYLNQVVVGYAEFCAKASRVRLGAGQAVPDYESVDVPGLQAVGDGEVQIHLRRPVNDLRSILALPALSPLPFEIREGFGNPEQFIGDGPYRFTEPEPGEVYRLSRNSAWDPAGDPVRAALVDRISFRGGLAPADVQQRLVTNAADLSWDAETPGDVLGRTGGSQTFQTARSDDRMIALLGVGTRGPAALRLTAAARSAINACLDRAALVTALGGTGRAVATADLLPPEYTAASAGDKSENAAPSPSASGTTTPPTTSTPTASASATSSAGTQTGTATTSTSSPSTSRPSTTSPPATSNPATSPTKAPDSVPRTLSVSQCRATLTRAGLRAGSPLRLLVADTAGERAAAGVLRDRLTAAGLDIDLRAVPAQQYSASTAAGGWDLTLLLLRPDYLGSRAVLTPLLDPRWPGLDAVGTLRRSPAWLTEMAAALGEESASRSVARQTGLATTITRDGAVMGLATVATVRTAGPNVGHSPALALLGNVDPANVALGVTRPGESPTSAPSSS